MHTFFKYFIWSSYSFCIDSLPKLAKWFFYLSPFNISNKTYPLTLASLPKVCNKKDQESHFPSKMLMLFLHQDLEVRFPCASSHNCCGHQIPHSRVLHSFHCYRNIQGNKWAAIGKHMLEFHARRWPKRLLEFSLGLGIWLPIDFLGKVKQSGRAHPFAYRNSGVHLLHLLLKNSLQVENFEKALSLRSCIVAAFSE